MPTFLTDLLAVAPDLDTVAWAQCHKTGEGDCPDAPRPILMERGASGWTAYQVANMPPGLAGTALAWTNLDEAITTLVYGTAGQGTWLGTLWWD